MDFLQPTTTNYSLNPSILSALASVVSSALPVRHSLSKQTYCLVRASTLGRVPTVWCRCCISSLRNMAWLNVTCISTMTTAAGKTKNIEYSPKYCERHVLPYPVYRCRTTPQLLPTWTRQLVLFPTAAGNRRRAKYPH